MAFVHNVDIVWDDLLDAFTREQGDRIYFLDRMTGEIFFVPSVMEDDDFWRHVESNRERFLEIPRIDYGTERQLMSGFIGAVEDKGLKLLLDNALVGKKPYGKLHEILSFFPEEEERLLEIKNEFFATRLKSWLEENNLFTLEMDAMLASRI
ncbi:MAG: UPF0158 family protein [Deltaproteobacteria bacterium]